MIKAIEIETTRTLTQVGMLSSYGGQGLRNLQLKYEDEEQLPSTEGFWRALTIPKGKYINGIRVNTNSESQMINRIDFLLSGEEVTSNETNLP